MNKKASLTNNLQSSSINNKNDEPTNESNQQSSPDKGKTKITPNVKRPFNGNLLVFENFVTCIFLKVELIYFPSLLNPGIS